MSESPLPPPKAVSERQILAVGIVATIFGLLVLGWLAFNLDEVGDGGAVVLGLVVPLVGPGILLCWWSRRPRHR